MSTDVLLTWSSWRIASPKWRAAKLWVGKEASRWSCGLVVLWAGGLVVIGRRSSGS